MRWRWKAKAIEEVREFDCLGHKFQANGKQKAHVKERVKRAASIMGQVWRLVKGDMEGTGAEEYGCLTD